MVSIIEIPMRAILNVAAPKIAEAAKHGDTKRVEEVYRLVAFYQLLSGLLIFAMIWVNIDNIFGIMPNGEQFTGGKWIFFYLGLAKLVELTLTCSHTVVSTSRYYKWNIYYTISVLVMSFVSTVFLIPAYGTLGAALAMLPHKYRELRPAAAPAECEDARQSLHQSHAPSDTDRCRGMGH